MPQLRFDEQKHQQGALVVGKGGYWGAFVPGSAAAGSVLTLDPTQPFGVSWGPGGGGGGGSPGGSTGQVQYNGSGSFAGAADLAIGAAGQLNFAAITNGSPSDGDDWRDATQGCRIHRRRGLNLYGGGLVFSQTNPVSGTQPSSLQLLSAAGAMGTLTLAANFLVPGTLLDIEATGYYTSATTSPGSCLFTFTLGAATIATQNHNLIASQTNKVWYLRGLITCTAAGASGSVFPQFRSGLLSGSGGDGADNTGTSLGATAAVTLDTTSSQAIGLTVTAANSASNLVALTHCRILAHG